MYLGQYSTGTKTETLRSPEPTPIGSSTSARRPPTTCARPGRTSVPPSSADAFSTLPTAGPAVRQQEVPRFLVTHKTPADSPHPEAPVTLLTDSPPDAQARAQA